MVLQWTVIKLTHMMMEMVTRGPQWNTLTRQEEEDIFVMICMRSWYDWLLAWLG